MSDSRAAKRKAKDKAFYVKSAKQAKKSAFELGPGQKGFICTTNNREKESIREAYNLLNEYADILYGSQKVTDKTEPEGAEVTVKKESTEIEDELSKEVADLKNETKKPETRRFQSVVTGVKNCAFIKTTLDDPLELQEAIMKSLEKKKEQKTRFLLRMLPILSTCKPIPDDIMAAAKPIIAEHLANFKSFAIIIKIRNNNLKREDVIVPMADLVKDLFPEIKVDLDHAEICIIVEVLRITCCIGVVPNYFGRAKYNLVELAQKAQ